MKKAKEERPELSPLPWKFVASKNRIGAQDHIEDAEGNTIVAFAGPDSGYPELDAQERVDGARIAECVNALEFVGNPSAMGDLFALVRKWVKILDGEGGQVGCIKGLLDVRDIDKVFRKLKVSSGR